MQTTEPGVDVRPGLYPNVIAALQILGCGDQLAIAAALDKHQVAVNEEREAEMTAERIQQQLGIRGRASDVEIEQLGWRELSFLIKSARHDKYLLPSTERLAERCKSAAQRGITVKAMFDEMRHSRRGREFDEDTQEMLALAAERARSSAGKDVA